MGHRAITGVSPRFQTVLAISDTLLCCGFEPVRGKAGEARTVVIPGCVVEVLTPYSMLVKLDGKKPLKSKSLYEVQRYLITSLLV